jgi:hypothetical protein
VQTGPDGVHGVVELGGIERLAELNVELGVIGEEGVRFGLEVSEERFGGIRRRR